MGPVKPWIVVTLVTFGCGVQDEPQPPSMPSPDATSVPQSDAASAPACEEGPGEVFETRIEPLLSRDRPASCTKCHAAGVNLSAFVTDDACGSMRCLVSQDLVDLDQPQESKLLEFIRRGFDPGENTGVTDEMVAAEYEGFLAWIEWSARCMDATCSDDVSQCPVPDTPLRTTAVEEPEEPEEPHEVLPLTLENYACGDEPQAQAFLDWVFPSQGRCGHCHAKDGAIAGVAGAPTWIEGKRNLHGAHKTIRNAYELGMINLDDPANSRMLLKPLKQEAGGIKHGGGGKFVDRTDELYVSMLTWITMQAECRRRQWTAESHPRRLYSR